MQVLQFVKEGRMFWPEYTFTFLGGETTRKEGAVELGVFLRDLAELLLTETVKYLFAKEGVVQLRAMVKQGEVLVVVKHNSLESFDLLPEFIARLS